MKLLLKLFGITAILAGGMYFSSTAVSDPAGQGYAEAMPVIFALLFCIPLAISIARTPIPEAARYRRTRRVLCYAPLAVAASPAIITATYLNVVLLFNFATSWAGLLLLLAGLGYWVSRICRKLKRSRQAKATQRPPKKKSTTAPPKPPKPPRTRKTICGTWAWVLPILAIPIGLLCGFLATQQEYHGYEAWAILAWALIPLILALCISPILAIISICRKEKYSGAAVLLLIPYGVSLAVIGLKGLVGIQ